MCIRDSIKTAKFRYLADVDGIDFGNKRELDKNQIDRLLTCEFIKKGQDVFITGSTGTGKSYLASAIGRQACLFGFKVYYTNTAKLLSVLKMAKADGSHIRELARIEKQDLLILDDCGIQSFDASGRALLMVIVCLLYTSMCIRDSNICSHFRSELKFVYSDIVSQYLKYFLPFPYF